MTRAFILVIPLINVVKRSFVLLLVSKLLVRCRIGILTRILIAGLLIIVHQHLRRIRITLLLCWGFTFNLLVVTHLLVMLILIELLILIIISPSSICTKFLPIVIILSLLINKLTRLVRLLLIRIVLVRLLLTTRVLLCVHLIHLPLLLVKLLLLLLRVLLLSMILLRLIITIGVLLSLIWIVLYSHHT